MFPNMPLIRASDISFETEEAAHGVFVLIATVKQATAPNTAFVNEDNKLYHFNQGDFLLCLNPRGELDGVIQCLVNNNVSAFLPEHKVLPHEEWPTADDYDIGDIAIWFAEHAKQPLPVVAYASESSTAASGDDILSTSANTAQLLEKPLILLLNLEGFPLVLEEPHLLASQEGHLFSVNTEGVVTPLLDPKAHQAFLKELAPPKAA